MTHPSSLDLEAFACGEVAHEGRPRATVADHLAVCAVCRAFVERLGGLVAAGPTAAAADALIARALARVELAPPVRSLEEAREARAASPLEARAPETKRREAREGKGRLWLLTTSIVTPLAAAAAILLLARSKPEGKPIPPAVVSTASNGMAVPDRILMAPLTSAAEPETTFKGGLQVAVVRDRGGDQTRFSSAVRVRPGDRLRVEVALDREQAILGAVLSDDGTYLELMPMAVRGPGTHFSEKSAKIDRSPTYGTIVIGTPEAVARARTTKQLDGVATLRVEWEGTP